MRIITRTIRVGAGTVGTFAILLSFFFAWRGISDHLMQVREHWTRYCADVWLPCALFSIVCIFIAVGSVAAYRKSTEWEHRLHRSRLV
jgi:hypothetical protein